MVTPGEAPTVDQLVALARAAREHAYAPYSRFKVGAALVGGSGRVYTGCNVENASYSHTCCAERTAVFKAVSEGETSILGIAIVTDTQPPASPCGSCRQVLHEFGADAFVVVANLEGEQRRSTVRAYLPEGFDPEVVLAAIRRGER
ncbi:MAG: cytidine deaminase [Myxococcota bacterium]